MRGSTNENDFSAVDRVYPSGVMTFNRPSNTYGFLVLTIRKVKVDNKFVEIELVAGPYERIYKARACRTRINVTRFVRVGSKNDTGDFIRAVTSVRKSIYSIRGEERDE